MISVGLIFRALGWQAVGAGMLAKGGYDALKQNQSERRTRNHYAPVTEWWARYGVSEDEAYYFQCRYTRSLGGYDSPALKDQVLNRLRSCVHSDDRYVDDLLISGGRDLRGRNLVVIMYYASMGRAARVAPSPNRYFPMAGKLDTKPAVRDVVLQLLKDNGVPDTHWFCDSVAEQESRLSAMG